MKFTDLIGNTPLVELQNMNPNPKVKVFVKLEGQNPGGSVKDRAAYGMINGALKRGEIKIGDKLIEATSGNTGIALAMIARVLGFPITLVMPDDATPERIKTMQAYGAEIVLTPGDKSIEYSRKIANQMVKNEDYYMLNQFGNQDNPNAHFKTTGPEIWKDTEGKITHFVSAMGTTGTIMGVSRYLKSQNMGIQIIGTQPSAGSRIPGIRKWSPEYLPKIYDANRIDRFIEVSEEQATTATRALANQEGIMCGMSSGGALSAALRLANELEEGVIVSIGCDRGDRYLSSDLY